VPLCLGGETPQDLKDPDWIKEVATQRIVYQIPEMKLVSVKKDIVYKHTSREDLRMDVYSPPEQKQNRPVVIFVHGGELPSNLKTKPKEWGSYVSYGELVAASGFVCVTLNLRFYDWADLQTPESDLEDALKYLQSHAPELRIDRARVCVWTLSAGGLFLSRLLDKTPGYLKCVVAYYPLFETLSEKPAPDTMRSQFSLTETLKRKTSPTIPIFIGRAGKDEPEINQAVDRTIQQLLRINNQSVINNHQNGQHGFDVLDNNDQTREVIRSTILFLQTHL
jgi:acetyl esterase/lipase